MLIVRVLFILRHSLSIKIISPFKSRFVKLTVEKMMACLSNAFKIPWQRRKMIKYPKLDTLKKALIDSQIKWPHMSHPFWSDNLVKERNSS